MAASASTGLKGLDEILNNLHEGDNIVWQVDSVKDYLPFVEPYYKYALENGLKPVYFRFAKHRPLISKGSGVEIHRLYPEQGFEKFIKEFHKVIDETGKEGCYIFDCISELVVDWNSDRMLGNFFMLVCPYIRKAGAIAYFALLRNAHSFHATTPITETLQILLDVYRYKKNSYVYPIKVVGRHSPTMNMIHVRRGDAFSPVTDSVTITKILGKVPWERLDAPSLRLGFWSSTFAEAEKLLDDLHSGKDVAYQIDKMRHMLLRMEISRNERVLRLAEKYFTMTDLLNIRRRMIGTGLIGGKSVGMLLARAILQKTDKRPARFLEPHDSFYIGSDVFYTFLVQNDVWWIRQKQESAQDFLEGAEEARQQILHGEFPGYIIKQFIDMLDYFGQSPIIVRSSSLLEDNFGNAFAGKYESIFCTNQGPRNQRLEEFMSAARRVYASAMSEDALVYRLQRGLDQQDEQMALLIQRVSGSYRNYYFFPDVAGVGISYNTFAWKSELDPKAGMLRLVLGLGTRAVNRVEDDYPRIVALDAPLLRPIAGMEDARKFSQHQVDLLDTQKNALITMPFKKLLAEKLDLKLDLVAIKDHETAKKMRELGMDEQQAWLLTFKKLLADTSFTQTMQKVLKILEEKYQYPIEIEFTVNFTKGQTLMINLLQCRPLQSKGLGTRAKIPSGIKPEKILFQCEGYFMGGNISQNIRRIVYVQPLAYIALPLSQKYDIARLVGSLNKQISNKQELPTLLLGPGRWGTTTPSLGVPVSFSEINNVTVLGEIAYEGANLMPELSFGTHFFQDLIEADIFYVAIFPQMKNVIMNEKLISQLHNQLCELLPRAGKYADVVKVYQLDTEKLQIICDVVSQKVTCFIAENRTGQ